MSSIGTMRRELSRLTEQASHQMDSPMLERIRQDPAAIMTEAGLTPDPWQTALLRSSSERRLLLCSRQAGKSTTAAALALHVAMTRTGALVLLLSPSLRQSGELFRKVLDVYRALDRPVATTMESVLRLELANGSRIISLPGNEETIRGFSGVALLLIDEAARVDDALYFGVRPMLAVSQGTMVCMTTPFGRRGWFYEAWTGSEPWERVKITAEECPRITPEFLAEERRALGDRWYAQEFQCSFEAVMDSLFSHEDVEAALSDDVQPLFVGGKV